MRYTSWALLPIIALGLLIVLSSCIRPAATEAEIPDTGTTTQPAATSEPPIAHDTSAPTVLNTLPPQPTAEEEPAATSTEHETTLPPPAPAIHKITISAIGDCIPGNSLEDDASERYPNRMLESGLHDYGYFFENVSDILRSDDLTIANLEGALTSVDAAEEKEYCYRGRPENWRVFAEGGVELLNLANNHSFDFGEQGYADTKANLAEGGLSYVEDGKSCITEIGGITVAVVGNCYDNSAFEEIKRVRERADIIIFVMHCGEMYDPQPTELQQNKARWAIQSGADLVIGHHPHILQTISEYRGKPVVFSLGNFSYGGSFLTRDYDTMIYQQTFTFVDGVLQSDADYRIIPCSVSSRNDIVDFRPTPYAPDSVEYAAFMEKFGELPTVDLCLS